MNEPLLHTCTPYCRHDPGVHRHRASKDLTIDFHCHVLTPAVEQLVADAPEKRGERALQARLLGEDATSHNEAVMMPPAIRRMTSMEKRLEDMDRMGVDIQVVSPSPTQYYYWADEGLAEQACRLQNEHIAHQCAQHAQRLRGLGTVALQHPRLAVEQLRHGVKKLGLQGVEISSHVNGLDIASERFAAFWSEAEKLGCVVFLHPLGTTLGERVNTHYLSNILGQPLETTVALSKLILDGVLDRHPGLKLVAAHGGGYLPYYFGRMDHGSRVRPEAGGLGKLPSAYLKNIWFDTVVYDPVVLRHLIDTVGATQIVVGTDYPFDMGDYGVHALLDSVPGLSEQDRKRILGLNAAALLNIPAAMPDARPTRKGR